jgi:hypothetical protein
VAVVASAGASFPLQLIVAGWTLAFLTSAPSAMAASVLTLAITVATVFISVVVAEVSYRSVELPAKIASQRQIGAGEGSSMRDRDLPARSR